MANPQVENGFTAISNELLEAIYKADLTRNEMKILLCIIRYTYGFHKENAFLSCGFLSAETSLPKSRVSESLNGLKGKNIVIVKKADGRQPQEIEIQKDFGKWGVTVTESVTVTENVTVTESVTVTENVTNRYGIRNHTVTENVTATSNKKNNKENINKGACAQSKNAHEGSAHIPDWFEEAWSEYPNKKGKNRISQKSYKELVTAGRDAVLNAVRNYAAYCRQNQWYHPQNGSTFFNGGWRDYIQNPQTCQAFDPYSLSVEDVF